MNEDTFLKFNELPKLAREKAIIQYIEGYERDDGDTTILTPNRVEITLNELKNDRYLIDGTFSHEVTE